MKRTTVYILLPALLLCCLAGCMRSNSQKPTPTPTPTPAVTPAPTAKPTQKPSDYSDGMVNDQNGILEDNDGNAATPDKPDSGLMDDVLNHPGATNDLDPYTPTPGSNASRARK